MRLNFTGLGKVEQNGYEILEFADSKTELSDGIYVKNLDNEYVKVEMRDFNVKISVGMDG